MMDLKTTKLVAEREIREQVRGKALWISTAITVVAVALLVILPHVLAGGPPKYRVAVTGVAPGAPLIQTIETAGRSAGATIRVFSVTNRAAAVAALGTKGSAHADIAVDLEGSGSVVVDRAFPSGSTDRKAVTARAIAHDVAAAKAIAVSGLSEKAAHALTDPIPLAIDHLRAAPSSPSKRIVGLAGAILFYLLVLRYGFGLLVGVVQEKSTRVIEVILSTVRPVDLLAGKVAGSASIVFAQGTVLVVTALISAEAIGSDVLQGSGAAAIIVAGVWIVIGYLLYAALFAAAGSLASKSEDAQSVSLPLQIPLLVGYFVAFTSLGSGSASSFVRVLAYIPFTAPMDMPVLAATGGATPWQVVLSMAITIATIVLTMRLATVIFSRAILRTGQRVRMREVVRAGRRRASVPG